MTAMRVTDLEKFSLEQIWRPYWPTWLLMHGEEWSPGIHLDKPPMGLHETTGRLKVSDRWSDCVIDRLKRCGVTFPVYVQHPLVDVVRLRVGDYTEGDPVPPSFEGYEQECARLCAALQEASELMDQLLLDVGSERPIVGPSGVNAWRVKAGLT